MKAANDATTVWQVAGGPRDRSYADIFLKNGLVLIGPGDAGPWSAEMHAGAIRKSDRNLIKRFADDHCVQPGHPVVLRSGRSTAHAVGVIAGPYQYCSQFDDVKGWDLQHGRRVRWCNAEPHAFDNQAFGGNPARFGRVRDSQVVNYVIKVLSSPPDDWRLRPLPGLPAEEPPLEIVPQEIQPLVGLSQDLFPKYWDEAAFGIHPTEDELVAHFLVPALRSYGWPVELIAVKWRDVDVAVFSKLPRIPENLRFIVEAKRLGAGIEHALGQAKGYLAKLGVSRDIVVSDGIRFRWYSAGDSFQEPVAYANLRKLKQSAQRFFELVRMG
jgi:hypothetical protein